MQGDTWTFQYDTRVEGAAMKVRIVLKEASPTLQTYRSDVSSDGAVWTTVLEGTLKKVK